MVPAGSSVRTRLASALVICGLAVVASVFVGAQAADPDPTRFAGDIDAFRQWDSKNTVPADGILFVGSSTIRLWPTAERFPGLSVINRGFGGSQISDVNHYFDDVVGKYRPATIVFYAGDNDINDGKTPQRVAADVRAFVSRAREMRADVRFFYLPIKPSPARWEKWPLMREANDLVRADIDADTRSRGGQPVLFYADVATPMLTADGQTQSHLYVADGLHLSTAGYDLWTQVLGDTLLGSSFLDM